MKDHPTAPPGLPVHSISTRHVPPGKELDYWREASGPACPVHFEAVGERRFHGDLALSRVGDLGLRDIRIGPLMVEQSSELLSRRGSDVLQFTIVTSGVLECAQEGRHVKLGRGSGAFVDGARPYTMLNREDVHMLVLQIPHVMMAGGVTGSDALINRDLALASELFPLVMGYVTQLAAHAAQLDALSARRVGGNLADLVNAMLADVARKTPFCLSQHTTAALMRVHAFVAAHLANPDLDPHMVSQALRLSPRYINKLLEAEGTSLGRLIWHRRLERIAADLRDPVLAPRTISTIALARGFNDLSHFSKTFRRRYGKTPREYRGSSL
ncbi:helix-turn-helix domain-containing protein [Pseudoduganella sp. LjRoot289]|uniref:AraC-like ligand-binding domain-containing protein n=1 Tax=Pseudoduganella sp. LjRoot289 TaxID=3342314 RepID=UPI003ECE730C